MLNPVFLLLILLSLFFSFYSISNWKLGLLVFFIYTQFFGILKRLILFIGLNNFSYNLLVVSQYVFLLSIIVGAIRSKNKIKSNGRVPFWFASFSCVLLISILISPFGLGIAIPLAVIQYFPIFIIIVGQFLEEKQVADLKSLLMKTAPIHAVYQIYQFFFGPFGFELAFAETKSSITNFAEGDFVRGIPLYDSVDPLYIHFGLVFLLLLKAKKNAFSYANMLLIIIALVLIGNRSGLIILFMGVFVWCLLEWKIPKRKLILSSFILLIVASLNIFGYLLMDVITNIESLNISRSDFGARLGSLGTYSDRIIGRQKASQNITFFGKGLGSSGLAAATLANKGFDYDTSARDLFAHDLVGEIILDLGIAGLLVFALLIWSLIKYCTYNREDSPFLAMILSSFLASSLLGGSFTYGRAGYFVFLFAGFLLNKRKLPTSKHISINA